MAHRSYKKTADLGVPKGIDQGTRAAVPLPLCTSGELPDPVARQLFYDRLLADYAVHHRTVRVGAVITSHAHAWPAIGRFLTTLSAAGLTGLLAALAVVLLAGGYTTMRRVTV